MASPYVENNVAKRVAIVDPDTGVGIEKNMAIRVAIQNADGSLLDWSTIKGGLSYLGVWDANANTPTLSDGSGSNGEYYVVSVAGTTLIDGENDWGIGDWIISNDTSWQKIDNSDTGTSLERAFDTFTVTSPSNKVYSLGHIAINDLAEVNINGVSELQDVGYIVSGSTVTIDNGVNLTTGDVIDVWYNYSI